MAFQAEAPGVQYSEPFRYTRQKKINVKAISAVFTFSQYFQTFKNI